MQGRQTDVVECRFSGKSSLYSAGAVWKTVETLDPCSFESNLKKYIVFGVIGDYAFLSVPLQETNLAASTQSCLHRKKSFAMFITNITISPSFLCLQQIPPSGPLDVALPRHHSPSLLFGLQSTKSTDINKDFENKWIKIPGPCQHSYVFFLWLFGSEIHMSHTDKWNHLYSLAGRDSFLPGDDLLSNHPPSSVAALLGHSIWMW